MKTMYVKLISFTAIIAVLTFAGCKKEESPTPTPTPGTYEVKMQNTAFNPSSITVTVNSTVKWTNMDGMTHNVISDSGAFNSGDIGASGSFSYLFTTPGTYTYHCSYHPGMMGTIVVKSGS